MTSIVDVEVSASPHRTLNTIRGVLSEDDFLDASEEEILEGLKDAGVVAVKRIMFRKDGEETPSKHVILTFERHTLPETVKAVPSAASVPMSPTRNGASAANALGMGHAVAEGKKLVQNVEARNMLLTSARQRPAVAKENITYLEAKKKLSFLSKGGYAEVVRRGPAPHLETRATQVSPEILAADLRAPSLRQEQHAAPLGKGSNPVYQGVEPGDGFTMEKPRRRTKASVGTAKSSSVVYVPRQLYDRALFVSRLPPDTTVKDIEALIEPFLGGAHPTGSKECPKKLAHRPPIPVSNHDPGRKDSRVNSLSRSAPEGHKVNGQVDMLEQLQTLRRTLTFQALVLTCPKRQSLLWHLTSPVIRLNSPAQRFQLVNNSSQGLQKA
ncbi:hypothetical protein ISCGN_013358 [Ixodes scapularis]